MRLFFCFALLCISAVGQRVMHADEATDFFERKIRPVLVEHCYACHSAEGDVEGGLRLDSRQAMQRGGESGPAIDPNESAESLLISAIKYKSLEMPPDRKLSDQIIGDFEKWIASGAHDPRDEKSEALESVESTIDFQKGRQFWSFQSPRRQELPDHGFRDWPRTRIDEFVAAKLELNDLQHSPRAPNSTLFRRLAFDLTGLPPAIEQLRAWEDLPPDRQADIVIQELMATRGFGEHWARLWLDIMRYADDQAHIVGDNKSLCFPNSYLYRDWVIDAFNRDMPYDEFLRLQLAADLITPDNLDDDVALGFVGLGPKYYRRNSPEVQAEEWEDRIDVLSRGLLGLTVACARCHDHKFDPIGTADYYAIAGVFASTEMFNRPLDSDRKTNKQGHAESPEDAVHVIRDVDPSDLSIMIRGDVNRRGPVVPRGFLTVLSADERLQFSSGSGRLELADSIASTENPLTARVFVNRVWTRLIGMPLVATPSNFGSLGEAPTHPQLLDDLSIRFMENGWSLKWLCREIVSSATYQQSSKAMDVDRDPQNRWLSHMNRKRLSVEQWRDSVLQAAGRLEHSSGGPSIDPNDPASSKRTIYSEASRLRLNPMLALFDYPDPNVHSASRARTTTASQKLFMMNSPFMVKNAAALAELDSAENASVHQLVEALYVSIFSRRPTSEELIAATDFLSLRGDNLPEYAHALMMSNEAIFID